MSSLNVDATTKQLNDRCVVVPDPHLQVSQRHLGHAELAGGLSVFTLPGQVVGDLLPHHPLLTLPQRTRDLEEWTHVQVVLQTGEAGMSTGESDVTQV